MSNRDKVKEAEEKGERGRAERIARENKENFADTIVRIIGPDTSYHPPSDKDEKEAYDNKYYKRK